MYSDPCDSLESAGQTYGVAHSASTASQVASMTPRMNLPMDCRLHHMEYERSERYELGMDVPNELLRAARVALNIGQRELAKLSGVGQRTILRIERNDETVTLESRRRLQDAFEKAGVTFVADDGVSGPGLRIRRNLIQQGNLRF